MKPWKEQAQVWKKMPRASSVYFFAGVFCLFSTLSLVVSGMNAQSQSALDIIGNIVVIGGVAMVWAYAGTRNILWLLVVAALIQTAGFSLLGWISSRHGDLNSAEVARHLLWIGRAEIVLLVAGYILFIFFFNREGSRFFKTQTEMRLAGEIHRTLVPMRHEMIGNVEIFGTSIPSSEVGGDLFDIVQAGNRWHAYVADVSGHGVAAGILMSMIKSAAAMQLTKLQKPEELLADLNDVMQPFTSPSNYLTLAYVSGDGRGTLNYALGGHLPIFHYQAQTRTIVEHSDANLPIGLFKNLTFVSSQLSVLPGDLLVIVTDGFTEISDLRGDEIGVEGFKSMLLACAEKPLPEIYQELRAKAAVVGVQTDDQTMLLLRQLQG